MRWCIAGIGGHARTKLLPALTANGQAIAGLVSRQPAADLPPAPLFRFIDAALASMPPDTCFLLASPPSAHFDQAIAAIHAGRDVMIEKPAFLTEGQAEAAMTAAVRSSSILVEAFMHRHSRLYTALIADFSAGDTRSLEIAFRIPSMPNNTFRQDCSVLWTCLYDIGCYAVSLLADLGLPLDDLALEVVDGRGCLRLTGLLNGIRVVANIGTGAGYSNEVALTSVSGARTTYAPFFYGRPGPRVITTDSSSEIIEEGDVFATMLAVPAQIWRNSQTARWEVMLAITACLERLTRSLPKDLERS